MLQNVLRNVYGLEKAAVGMGGGVPKGIENGDGIGERIAAAGVVVHIQRLEKDSSKRFAASSPTSPGPYSFQSRPNAA